MTGREEEKEAEEGDEEEEEQEGEGAENTRRRCWPGGAQQNIQTPDKHQYLGHAKQTPKYGKNKQDNHSELHPAIIAPLHTCSTFSVNLQTIS